MAVSAPASEFEVIPGGVCAAQGFTAAGVAAGIKRSGKPDVTLLVCTTSEPTAAGVFTTNVVRAPSVERNEQLLREGAKVSAVVVNAGNANAGNGPLGDADNARMAELAATQLGIEPAAVLTASTGVIGTPMPMAQLEAGIASAAGELAATPDAAARAAEAIMTTDLVSKEFAVAVRLPVSGQTVHIGGMSKGSGMIAPNMATMLAFVTTDAVVPAEVLDSVLRAAVEVSFNCLTVDGDTSTNDSCIALASGASGAAPAEHPEDLRAFTEAFSAVCLHLAKAVARDGEGATKLVTVRVTGGATREDARRVAKTIAESPLVKTALFGNDPNWGRILAAAGRAGVRFDPQQASAYLAGTCIYRGGVPTQFDAPALSKAMAAKDLDIVVELGMGEASAEFYTCDLSYDYVRINAEYHT